MTVEEYTAKVSHKEHRAWLHWLHNQWNCPNRTDWYLMQIAFEIRRLFNRIDSYEPFKLKFGLNSKNDKPSNYFPMPSAAELAAIKARWLSGVGYREEDRGQQSGGPEQEPDLPSSQRRRAKHPFPRK